MKRAKYDIHECNGLAQEQFCISYLMGRMPLHLRKQNVFRDEHVINIIRMRAHMEV
mgnify:FL=1